MTDRQQRKHAPFGRKVREACQRQGLPFGQVTDCDSPMWFLDTSAKLPMVDRQELVAAGAYIDDGLIVGCSEHPPPTMLTCTECGMYLGNSVDSMYQGCVCVARPEPEPDYYAAKKDQGKLRPRLLPWGGIPAVLEISEFGLSKGYAEASWKTVPDAEARYAEAFRRHALAVMEDIWARCPESGLPHIAHAGWNALALLALRKKGGDGVD